MNDLELQFIKDQIKKGINPLKNTGFKSFEEREEYYEKLENKNKDKNQIDLFNNSLKQNNLFER